MFKKTPIFLNSKFYKKTLNLKTNKQTKNFHA